MNVSDFESPVGTFGSDYTSAVTTAACGNGTPLVAATGAATTPAGGAVNVGCVPLAALFDAAQSREPASTFSIRIDQPWGHLRLGTEVVQLSEVED